MAQLPACPRPRSGRRRPRRGRGLIEHKLPLSTKRTDAILAGVHPKTGRSSYLVVELKQWSTVRPFQDSPSLVDVDGGRYSPVLHPSLQVGGYVDYLSGPRHPGHRPEVAGEVGPVGVAEGCGEVGARGGVGRPGRVGAQQLDRPLQASSDRQTVTLDGAT